MGHCALHTTRSLAVSHAASAASPVSTSSCCINGWRGRPRGRFHCGLLSGRWPVLALTARCSVMWAGVTSGSRLTWPNIAWRHLVIFVRQTSIKYSDLSYDIVFSVKLSCDTVVKRRSLVGELSLSCARRASDEWPVMWANRPLHVCQLGQLSLSFFRGR